MKWLVIISYFCFSPLFARTSDLLKCLGQEEKKLHLEKTFGPNYELNQRLIDEIIQIPQLKISPQNLHKICQSSSGPSWKLLELSLFEGDSLFINEQTGMQKNVNQGMISDYLESVRGILLNLIASVQMLSKDPNCLNKNFPKLNEFYTELKYLQEEMTTEKIFEGKEKKIFEKLKNYQKMIQQCNQEIRKKLKSRDTTSLR